MSAKFNDVGPQAWLADVLVRIADYETVERSTCPIPLNRKNAPFAGSDGGAEHWPVVASLIETCKLNHVESLGYLDVLPKIATRAAEKPTLGASGSVKLRRNCVAEAHNSS
ncbi:hypothetical protein MESS2_p110010 [Mesorhizobium metallidurans STM 2683]|uniref:Transposase IS66 C-terminal domain-containing protein n=1 Tax=Mesorhizobium metallidurans STM 2683 TaxID=1297569 RepID=M5FBY7_9HYPH|nr:hypothetical protein MESS2_p110010 [Mesorhizobium metallidurans STM 2683]